MSVPTDIRHLREHEMSMEAEDDVFETEDEESAFGRE
jgi:hypothetical protein